jgi:hypothetical protein
VPRESRAAPACYGHPTHRTCPSHPRLLKSRNRTERENIFAWPTESNGLEMLTKEEQDALPAQDKALRQRGVRMGEVELTAVTLRNWTGEPDLAAGPSASSGVPLAGFPSSSRHDRSGSRVRIEGSRRTRQGRQRNPANPRIQRRSRRYLMPPKQALARTMLFLQLRKATKKSHASGFAWR